MFIGSLLPAAVAARKPRRAERVSDSQTTDAWTRPLPAYRPEMLHGVTAIEVEVRSAIGAVSGLARDRTVELQMAFEPQLFAQAEAAEFRSCLRELLAAAIVRAESGVLITGMRRSGMVEIAVLDDGRGAAGEQLAAASDDELPQWCVLPGASWSADSQPDRGTTVLLRLRIADADSRTH